MCRIAAYLGPPVRLSALLHETPHGLTDQSRNARQMTDSSVAGDGWGIGWFCPEAGPTPGLLKSILPLWSDENARTATHAIRSGSVVGHIRYASPNIETCFVNTPLYVLDDHLWTINGELQPWPGPLSKAMRDRLDPDHEADVRVRHRRRDDGRPVADPLPPHRRPRRGRGPADHAPRGPRPGPGARRRDQDEPHPGRLGHGAGRAVRRAGGGEHAVLPARGGPLGGGAVVASEPLDDGPGWHEVGPDTLVRADGRGVRLEPLDLDRAELAPQRRQSA